jgi:hypothetical protein
LARCRVAALFSVFIAPVAAGVLVLPTLLTPALQAELGKRIPMAAIIGLVVAIPIAWTIAKSFAGKAA